METSERRGWFAVLQLSLHFPASPVTDDDDDDNDGSGVGVGSGGRNSN